MTKYIGKNKSATKSTASKPQECPFVFRNTYILVNSCDSTVAYWSGDGDIFLVTDPDGFTSRIIPQYFKHNNFISFVCKLNFYGFHKIRYLDSLKIDPKVKAKNKDTLPTDKTIITNTSHEDMLTNAIFATCKSSASTSRKDDELKVVSDLLKELRKVSKTFDIN